MPRLSDLGEDALVARLTALLAPGAGVLVGPGDDCAAVEGPARGQALLLKTDCLVEDVHFTREANSRQVGWKAIARTLSDLAAMGGWPEHLLVTLALPPDRELRWVENLYRGMSRCARQFDCAVVGGETSSVPKGAPAMISVAAAGKVRRARLVTRAGGRPGDVLYVTGRLGGSLRGRHLTFTPRLVEAKWLTANFRLHAMMDLSDGLGADLPRLATASQCAYLLDLDALPRARGVTAEQAVGDGEDYELLFALSPRSAPRLEGAWKECFPDLPLSRIGRLVEGSVEELAGGWDHFAS